MKKECRANGATLLYCDLEPGDVVLTDYQSVYLVIDKNVKKLTYFILEEQYQDQEWASPPSFVVEYPMLRVIDTRWEVLRGNKVIW